MTTVATAPPTGRGIPQPGMSLAELRPDLAAEWSPQNTFGPERVGASSNIKVWWICEHHPDIPYAMIVANRSHNNSVCGCKNGRTLVKGINDLLSQRPDLAKEWSSKNKIAPDEVFVFSNKKAWWTCRLHLDMPYESRIINRSLGSDGCGCESGNRLVPGLNDLATLRPDLVAQWHASNVLSPQEVSIRSSYRAKWICEHHPDVPYIIEVHSRTRTGAKTFCTCMSSTGRKKVLPKVNDLATLFPSIARDWHPTLNKGLTPSDVMPFSNKRFWWSCLNDEKHNPWIATINSRVHGKTGCPTCSKFGQSRLESAFRERFAQSSVLTDVSMDPHAKLPFKWSNGHYYRVDILGTLNDGRKVVVEYDGKVYHDGTVDAKAPQRDLTKTQTLLDNGYIVVRIRENGLANVPLTHPCLLQVQHVAYAVTSRDLGDVNATSRLIEDWLEKV